MERDRGLGTSSQLDGMEGFCYYTSALEYSIPKISGGAMNQTLTMLFAVLLLTSSIGCAGGSLSTREKGAGIGALGGAAVGGIIGAAVGHPGAGAAIGGALGLGTGALVGDQLQGQEIKQADQQRQLNTNQAELERQRRELEQLKRQQGEY
jgi:phage tail tape-measure protein